MKDAYWFSHDCNAASDPKCLLLIDQLGLEGYGIYWILVETLRDQPEYKYPINLLPALARRYNTTAEKINTVVRSYGLFVIENDEVFFSESLINRMMILDGKRDQARKAAHIRWGKCGSNADALHEHCGSNAIKVKYSKVNNNIILPKGNCETTVPLDPAERINHQKIIDLYNSTCISLPKVEKITEARRRKIKSRRTELKKQYPDRSPEEVLTEIFCKAEASGFLKGDNSNGWKASFDWILENDKNWIKILEGNYDNTARNNSSTNRHGQVQKPFAEKEYTDSF